MQDSYVVRMAQVSDSGPLSLKLQLTLQWKEYLILKVVHAIKKPTIPGVFGDRYNGIYFRIQGIQVWFLVEQEIKILLGNMEHKKTFCVNRGTMLFISGEQGNKYYLEGLN